MTAPPLIVGNADDVHAAAVMDALRIRSVEPVVVDVATLESVPYSMSGGALKLSDGNGREISVALEPPTRGWIRRLAPPGWRSPVELDTEEAAARGAWATLIAAIAGARYVDWLTPLERLFIRNNKLLQTHAAERLGITTPATVVTSEPGLIPPELGERLLVKPLGAAHYTDAEGVDWVVWAQTVQRGSELLERLAGAPFILQQAVEAERHLRVVTVEDRCWVCELPAEGLPIDWRRHDPAHESFVAVSEPAVSRDAVRLANELAVGYSSQDWVVTGDTAYFLDLNPGGQWIFLPDEVAAEVTGAIASWLIG